MKIKKSKELTDLASILEMPSELLEMVIIHKIEYHSIIEEIPENYGLSIAYILEQTDLCLNDVYRKIFYFNDEFNERLLGKLEIIGDGDCPECGGESEHHDGEKRGEGPDEEFIWEDRKCTNCDHVFTI